MTVSPQDNYRLRIQDLPDDERPRERLKNYGAAALSNAELLAILLRTGIKGENVITLGTRLLSDHGGLMGLSKATFSELSAIKGLGPAKTCQLKAALELGRRLMVASPNERPQITGPEEAANLLMLEMQVLQQEHLRLLIVDTKNYVLATPTIYIGNVNSTVVRISEIFQSVIRENAPAFIMAHNHPSGDPTPSPEDVHMTKRVIKASQLLDIEVLDHIIIGHQRYISMREQGVAF
ncbi:MAG: DNA repair protein RadC [Chloroflexota bacterium]